MDKTVIVFSINGELFISLMQRTIYKAWIGMDEHIKVSCNSEPGSIGKAARKALNSCRYDVPEPQPDAWKKSMEPLLKDAGEKTYASFARKASLCDIFERSGEILITPSLRKRGGAFLHLNDKKIILPVTASDEELGDALLRAFELCE